MDKEFIDIIIKSGMGVGAFVILCAISYAIIKHILKQSDTIMSVAMKTNAEWQKVIDEHTLNAKEFHNISSRAFEYIREEHKELSQNQRELLQEIREMGKSIEIVNKSLEETEKALGRINGHKNE